MQILTLTPKNQIYEDADHTFPSVSLSLTSPVAAGVSRHVRSHSIREARRLKNSMTRLAAPVEPFSGAMSPNFFAALWLGGGSSSGTGKCDSVRLRGRVVLKEGDLEYFDAGLEIAISVAERVIEVFDGVVGFSFFLERTVAPGGPPRTGTFRVVVFDRVIPPPVTGLLTIR